MPMAGTRTILTVLAAAALAAAWPARAETFTPATTKLLADLKLDAAILAGLDRELAVPASWIEGARREGLVKVRTTAADPRFARAWGVFEARYPFLKYEHVRGIGRERAVVPLMAYKQGTFVSDVVSSIEALEDEYRKAGALIDLRELPGYANVEAFYTAPDGVAVSYRKQHYCMTYDPAKQKRSDLPKTWDDLVGDPRWRNGRVGMAVNVHTWIAPLWGIKGDAWAEGYMDRIFREMKPQLRKERLAMLPQLTSLGEFELGVPITDLIVAVNTARGMSVSFHCPDIVPMTAPHMAILKGTPRLNAAKLFVNWVLSKEGQLAMHWADAHIPVHRDLNRREFVPFPDAVLGKRFAPQDARVLAKIPEIAKRWQTYWIAGGGAPGGAGD